MLPFLFSLGLPALASTNALGSVLGGMSGATLAGLGAGLGSFLETGDIGKGLKTGLTSVFAGKLLNNLGGGKAAETELGKALGMNPAMAAQNKYIEEALKIPAAEGSGFIQTGLKSALGDQAGTALTQPGILNTAFLGQTAADLYNPPEMEERGREKNPPPDPLPPIRTAKFRDRDEDDSSSEFNYFDYYRPPRGSDVNYPYRYSIGGILGGGATHPMFMGLGQNIARALSEEQSKKVQPFIQKVEQDAKAEFGDEIFNMPQMQGGKGQGLGLLGAAQRQASQIAARPFQDVREYATTPDYTGPKNELTVHPDFQGGHQGLVAIRPGPDMAEPIQERPPNPFMAALGGVSRFRSALGMAEGGEIAKQAGMNEKEVIVEAVKAIKGISQNPEIALGIFVEKYGEEALRDLVQKVQSGALDDTIERFANGEKGMVEGPGDGSGEDDKVPATLDGEQDVLLTEGEFVIRQPTTQAIEEEFGAGFLDKVNQAEEDAPEKIKEMVG
tara:strand:+ start:5518 stop:7020 length:1503 start_codon:yes stop_codon:yes gene_type:complete